MKTLLCIAAVLLALSSIEARAGTQLQIQFQQWVYQGHGLAKLMVTLRNPTMKPFARVVWDCDLLDKESHVVGRATLIFHVVPWGALVVDTQPVYSNGMFQDGECRLIRAEEVTDRNERLYRGSPNARVIGLALPAARQFFDFDSRIQGRAVVISEEDDQALEQERKDNPTLFKSRPGYRD